MISFDTLMLDCALRELEERAIGARVERITQPFPNATQWTLYVEGAKMTLLIVSDASDSRMHITRRGRAAPPNPPGFCMILRKLLTGARLEAIERPLGLSERVARLLFAGTDGRDYAVHAELMGRHGNQILVNDNGYILGAIKRVTPEMSRLREVRPGIAYTPPPSPQTVRSDIFSRGAFDGLPAASFESEADAAKWAQNTFAGLSPLMAREGVALRTAGVLSAGCVAKGLENLVGCALSGTYSPVLLTDQLGRITGAYPVALKSLPASQQPPAQSFSTALDDAAEALEQRGAFDTEKTALLAALQRAARALEKEQIDVDEGLSNAERADSYRMAGELILAYQAQVTEGANEVQLPDYDTGESIAIDLDPTLTPQKNAERYFLKYKKANASHERLLTRAVAIRERARRVSDALPRVHAAMSVETVQAIKDRLEDLPELSRRGSPAAGAGAADAQAPAPFPGYKIRTYHSTDGWEILVGENAESNDYLTVRVAAPSDIWLHARAQVSAHAVIRTRNRPDTVSNAALRLAAAQVARRSSAKHSHLVPVDYTLRKYVRKPRGAKPGAALYSREKTIEIAPGEDD